MINHFLRIVDNDNFYHYEPSLTKLFAQSDEFHQELYSDCVLIPLDHLRGPDSILFVAEINHYAIGCAALVFNGFGPNDFVELKRVFIDPLFRGNGIANNLLGYLINYSSNFGIHKMYLELGPKQPEAFSLYKKFGFVECGPFGSWKEGPHSIFMEKNLCPWKT